MTLNLPWPPSVNHYWRHNRGQFYIDSPGKSFRVAVQAAYLEQRINQPIISAGARLDVRVIAHPPDKRRRDIDNIAKATLDALVHAGVIEDDGHIDQLLLVRGNRDEMKAGRVCVHIEPMRDGR